jgi:hypothetical protein
MPKGFATFLPGRRIVSKVTVILEMTVTSDTDDSEVKMTNQANRVPWYLWPFAAIWKLLAVIVEMTGRLVAMILGILLMVAGALVSLTIVGAIIGIPLAIVGLLLFIKGIF